MKFSSDLKESAIENSIGELAWKKEDVYQAIDELSEKGLAILGADVWSIRLINDEDNPVTIIDSNRIAVGILKGADGQNYIFNWNSEKQKDENWHEFVARSKEESLASIEKLCVEETVEKGLINTIYYNLVYCTEQEFEELIKK